MAKHHGLSAAAKAKLRADLRAKMDSPAEKAKRRAAAKKKTKVKAKPRAKTYADSPAGWAMRESAQRARENTPAAVAKRAALELTARTQRRAE